MTFDYNSKDWEKLRKQALVRDGYLCQFCGALCLGKKRNGISPTVDHIQPVKDRPDLAYDLGNLRVLCKSCDNQRHSEKGRGYEVTPIGEDGYPIDSEWS